MSHLIGTLAKLDSSNLLKGPRRKSKKFLLRSNMFASSKNSIGVEAILKYYWRGLNVILNKFPKSIISRICFQLNRGEKEKCNISSRYSNILKVKKTNRGA
jgi:hypothetical protein